MTALCTIFTQIYQSVNDDNLLNLEKKNVGLSKYPGINDVQVFEIYCSAKGWSTPRRLGPGNVS